MSRFRRGLGRMRRALFPHRRPVAAASFGIAHLWLAGAAARIGKTNKTLLEQPRPLCSRSFDFGS